MKKGLWENIYTYPELIDEYVFYLQELNCN